ncbi:LysR family transcriptional regulator [Cupriavidus sp. Marseille-Q8015]
MDDLSLSHQSAAYPGIIAFMAVATTGSFAGAGRRLGIGRSAVCRNVQKLETQLNTRLFLRTTRLTKLTLDGERFFQNCQLGVTHIANAIDDLIDRREGPPRGFIRVSAPVTFGRWIVAPLLDRFLQAFPDVQVELLLDDRPTDFATDQVDVAFRNGRVSDTQIVAKQLVPMRMVTVAGPSYIEQHGLPKAPENLDQHTCINYRFWNGQGLEWEFSVEGVLRKFIPEARLIFNNFDLILRAALQGQGVAHLPGYLVSPSVKAGDLSVILPKYEAEPRGHYICYLCRQHMPSRVRVFIDFMTEEIRRQRVNDFDNCGDNLNRLKQYIR